MDKPPLLGRAFQAAVDAFNRNPWTEQRLQIVDRGADSFYAEDGLWTYHAHPFAQDPRFDRAYERAVRAGGDDYRIRWRVHTILWAAERAAAMEGAFVECGTGRGFMASAICDYLEWGERPFYLYDTFESTPPAGHAVAVASAALPNYATGADSVRANFAVWPGVQLVVGRIPETLQETGRVAFLHIDLNHPAAEEAVVRHFWPRLAPGASMVFDDYGFEGYEAQRESADSLGLELGFRVLSLPTGQGLVIR